MSNKLRYASPVKRLSKINLLRKQKSSRIRIHNIFHYFQKLFSCSAIMPVSPPAPSVLLCTLVLSAAGVNFMTLHCGFIHSEFWHYFNFLLEQQITPKDKILYFQKRLKAEHRKAVSRGRC